MNATVLPGVAPDGRCLMCLSDMAIQEELHREGLPAQRAPVETSRVTGKMKLELELGAAADAAEDATRNTTDAGCRGRAPRSTHRAAVRQRRDHRWRVHASHVCHHFSLAPEEAPTVITGSRITARRRVLVVGDSATSAAPIHLAFLAVLHREVHLYRHPGVERVATERAPIEMMRVYVEQVSLQQVRMRVELLARVAYVLLADLAEVVLGQVCEHVLAIREDRIALGTRMLQLTGNGRLLIAPHMVRLKMPSDVLAERVKVLERGTALGAQQGTSGVSSTGRIRA